MLALNEFRQKPRGLADLINYAAMIDDGIVLGKDGTLIAGYYYRGEDTASASHEYLAAVSAQINAAMTRLGSGWMLHIDATRIPASGYPESGAFPDAVTQLIDAERRQQYTSDGQHFETIYVIVISWAPPSVAESKAQSMLVSGDDDTPMGLDERALRQFKATLTEFESAGASSLNLQRMLGVPYIDKNGRKHVRDDLLAWLNCCIKGEWHPLNLPPVPMYLDAVLGMREFVGGIEPRVADQHIRVIAIDGFPQESYPGILDALNALPMQYRWSTRFIVLDPEEAKAALNKYRKKWRQQIFGLKAALFRTGNGPVNQDAADLTSDAELAMSEAGSGVVRFGYYTTNVILRGKDVEQLAEAVQYVRKTIQQLGFSTRLETLNTVEAWLGSLPGHGVQNIRRPLMHSLNLADLMPSTSTWAGPAVNPCPFYPPNSPPLLYANTTGATPFRLSLHVGDVGHTMILGPTGSGKSTLLAFLAAQHFRYPNAQVFAFDKGYSLFTLANACKGRHFDIAGEHAEIAFYPLASIDNPAERSWAADWLETLLMLQKVEINPAQRKTIHKAVELLGGADTRTMTELVSSLQDQDLRDALNHYTLSGAMGRLLDSDEDGLAKGDADASFTVFELEHLMSLGDKNVIPVLTYLFHRVEQRLDGRPTLLILDEAWLLLDHPVFREKIREWLKVLRKANCAVVFATQSISDVAKSPIADVLFESCPTKILLPNREARQDASRAAYEKLGLNPRQVDIIASAMPKRQYYYMSPEGKRLFDLALGRAALAFVGKSGKDDIAVARKLIAEYGPDEWVNRWLQHCGVF